MPVVSEREMNLVVYPLLDRIVRQYQEKKTVIIGIQGGQGTGKTTLAKMLSELLKAKQFTVQLFSIDNFYSSNKERKQLARRYPDNQFYQIPRGMPGTHRIGLLRKTLKSIAAGQPFKIPLFDKSLNHGEGDITANEISVIERPDFVLFEGWCLGLPSFTLPELKRICQKSKINLPQLDPRGTSTKLLLAYSKKYRPLWKYLDYLVQLVPESSSLHLKWRLQQEAELKQKKGEGQTIKQIIQFVTVFLPLTYLCYEKLKPDLKIKINAAHQFYDLR